MRCTGYPITGYGFDADDTRPSGSGMGKCSLEQLFQQYAGLTMWWRTFLGFGRLVLGCMSSAVFALTCEAQPVFTTEIVEGYLVTAPNGNRLWVKIIQPRADVYLGQSFPAVVSVPGGLGAGEAGNLNVAADGFVEFHFNAEGRGTVHSSDGTEDCNGFVHQSDLKAVIEFAHTRPNVIDWNLGVSTSSYGITMGAGCLGRYAGLEVKYLVDNEGPSESFVHCFEPWSLDSDSSNDRLNAAYNMFHHWSIYRDSSAANQLWWSEREPIRYIGNIGCRYLRVQAEYDHAQPPNALWPGFDYPPSWYPCKHTIDMINLATRGSSPWTRVNGLPLGNQPNTTYSRELPPVYYTQSMQTHPGEIRWIIREMANMPPLAPTALTARLDGSGQHVLLRWRSVAGAAEYRVHYDSVAAGAFSSYETVLAPDTTAFLNFAAPRMFYWVTRAVP